VIIFVDTSGNGGAGAVPAALKLSSSTTTSTGVVAHSLERAGALRYGAFSKERLDSEFLQTRHIASDTILVDGVEANHDPVHMAVQLRAAGWLQAPSS
jgi:hypothetical protein